LTDPLYLLGLFEGQAHAHAGKTPANQLPLIAVGGEIATTAQLRCSQDGSRAEIVTIPRPCKLAVSLARYGWRKHWIRQ
jgi:hypothetical protein